MPFSSIHEQSGFPEALKSGEPRHTEVHAELVKLRNAMNAPDPFQKAASRLTWEMLYSPRVETGVDGICHVRNSPEQAASLAAATVTLPALADALAMFHGTSDDLPEKLMQGKFDRDGPPHAAARIAAFAMFYDTFARSVVKQVVFQDDSDSDTDGETQPYDGHDGQGTDGLGPDMDEGADSAFASAGAGKARAQVQPEGDMDDDALDSRPPVRVRMRQKRPVGQESPPPAAAAAANADQAPKRKFKHEFETQPWWAALPDQQKEILLAAADNELAPRAKRRSPPRNHAGQLNTFMRVEHTKKVQAAFTQASDMALAIHDPRDPCVCLLKLVTQKSGKFAHLTAKRLTVLYNDALVKSGQNKIDNLATFVQQPGNGAEKHYIDFLVKNKHLDACLGAIGTAGAEALVKAIDKWAGEHEMGMLTSRIENRHDMLARLCNYVAMATGKLHPWLDGKDVWLSLADFSEISTTVTVNYLAGMPHFFCPAAYHDGTVTGKKVYLTKFGSGSNLNIFKNVPRMIADRLGNPMGMVKRDDMKDKHVTPFIALAPTHLTENFVSSAQLTGPVELGTVCRDKPCKPAGAIHEANAYTFPSSVITIE